MIDFCVKEGLPIDFISTHSYGVREGFLDETGSAGTVLDERPEAVSGDVLGSRRQISESAMPGLELHYTEWSSSYTPRDPIHDSYHQASYVLEKLRQVGDSADSMSYWVFSDIFEEAGPRFEAFHGGFGLLNYQGIKKSAYHSYAFMNRLGPVELDHTDGRAYVCRDGAGAVQILFWDFSPSHPGGKVNNQDHYCLDLPARKTDPVRVELSGLPHGDYRLERRRIGYRCRDPHMAYIDMGRPSQLTREQVARLKEESNDEPDIDVTVQAEEGRDLILNIDIWENDVHFITLSPETD
jgi:xylan 1,4-beta-xylosidase